MSTSKTVSSVAVSLLISLAGSGLAHAAPMSAEERAREIERIRINDKPLREDVIGNALIEGLAKGAVRALLKL